MNYGFIGYGNMGNAIVNGMIKSGYNQDEIYVSRGDYNKFDSTHKFVKCHDIQDIIDNCEVIFLCVKPNKYEYILSSYNFQGCTIVSIGAGITSDFMNLFVSDFILTMPNTSCEICKSQTSIVKSGSCNFTEVINLFNDLGSVYIIGEDEMSNYIALLGSSPAYFYYFIQKLAYSSGDIANEKELAKVMLNCAENIIGSDLTALELQNSVCSEGGCTVEFVKNMESQPELIDKSYQSVINKAEAMKIKKS